MRRLPFVFIVLVGCGGGGGLGPGAISASEAEGPCRDYCEWEAGCDSTVVVDTCTADCVDDVAGCIRGDVVEAIVDCQAGLSCSADDDVCLAGIDPLGAHADYEEACRAGLDGCFTPEEIDGFCESSGDPGNEDVGFIRLIAPEIVAEATACFDGGACDAQLACVQGVLEDHCGGL